MDGSTPRLESRPGRRSLRRSVRLETDVMSELWDGAVPLLATDLSLQGLWLESDLPLHVGSELAVSFVPPRWPHAAPFCARARVARVALARRRLDASGPGLDVRAEQAARLAEALRGVPPPLPRLLATRSRVRRATLTELELEDGRLLAFRAEAPLLTAARGQRLTPWPPGSPMSAILDACRRAR
jgi:hypothetical protein